MKQRSLILLLGAAGGFSQTASQITGRISDASGARVPEASVIVTNVETTAARNTVSNAAGQYRLPFLAPGRYRIEVLKEGFKPATREPVRLEVNQVAQLDFTLEVGSVSESVEVAAVAPLLESSTSALGQVVENKLIEDLPLNGRNFVQLAILGPGVVGVGFGARGTIMSGTRPDDLRPGAELFSNGNREQSNNFLMDGADNNFRRNGMINLRPSVEAIREFKIQTNLFAAEQGRNPGATINVVTKSGSNAWHGSAYEFLRNSKLDARNYFAPADTAKPAFRQNQFGASFSGPAEANRLFFFTNYEGYRHRLVTTSVNTTPIDAVRRGDFTGVRDVYDPRTVRRQAGTRSGFVRDPFPGRQVPAARFDPVTAKLIQAYPAPQRGGLANNHTSHPKQAQEWNQGDARMDYNLSRRDTLFGRYSIQDTTTFRPTTFLPVPLAGLSAPVGLGNDDPSGDSVIRATHAVLNWTRTLSPTFILEAHMGFGRFSLDFRQGGAANGAKLGEKLGVPNANQGPYSDGIPIFAPSGFTGIGQSRSLPTIRVENTFHPAVNLTRVFGDHSLKFGFDLRRRHITDFQTNRGNGRFAFDSAFTSDPNDTAATGDSMAGFLLGAASAIEQDFLLMFPGIRVVETGSFFQDDWRVSGRLTLNLGVRYELDPPAVEVADRWTNFDVSTGKLRIAGFNSGRRVGVTGDRNNFAPRFGFAVRARATTLVRGGFGIFYNTQGNGEVYFRRHRVLPFGPVITENIDQFSAAPRRVQDGLQPIPPLDFRLVADNPSGSFVTVADNFKSGYAQQFNLQIQQEVPRWNLVFKAGYVGNLSRQLLSSHDYNQPVPGAGTPASRRALRTLAPSVTGVTYATSDGMSNYHALQATAERRFSGGLSFLTSYTWAHSIDNVPNEQGGASNGPVPQDFRNRALDRATSGHDVQHRLLHSMTWEVPVGAGRRWRLANPLAGAVLGDWQINGWLTSQTGLPFTPLLQTSVSNAGASRPDRLGSGKAASQDPVRWFDTSFNVPGAAWAVPRQYTYGNAGRNILRGPGRINLDFSAFKDFPLDERFRLQFRAEFFNLLNTPQFDLPNAAIGNPAAGSITGIVGNPRQLQFALRLAF